MSCLGDVPTCEVDSVFCLVVPSQGVWRVTWGQQNNLATLVTLVSAANMPNAHFAHFDVNLGFGDVIGWFTLSWLTRLPKSVNMNMVAYQTAYFSFCFFILNLKTQAGHCICACQGRGLILFFPWPCSNPCLFQLQMVYSLHLHIKLWENVW